MRLFLYDLVSQVQELAIISDLYWCVLLDDHCCHLSVSFHECSHQHHWEN
jgi:hypothetical protein